MGGEAEEGDIDDGSGRQGRHHGAEQTLRKSQQESPLQLGKQGEKGRILKEGKVPALESLHSEALGGGAPQTIHAETNPFHGSQTNGHG
jgi:hypothetical protein